MAASAAWLSGVGFIVVLAGGLAASPEHQRPGTRPAPAVVVGSVTPVYVRETGGSIATPLYVNVTGTWDCKRGWHQLTRDELGDESVARRLAPEGTTWALYRLGQSPAAAHSRTAVVVAGDTEDVAVEAAIPSPRIHALLSIPPSITEPFLAVSSRPTIGSPSVQLLPPRDNLLTDRVRTALGKLGKRLDFRVNQNVAADLDLDGRTDQLVAIDFPGSPDSEAMVLALFDRNDGDSQTTVVRDTTDELWGAINRASILAVLDLDNDGFCEIALEVYGSDLSAFEVHHYDGGKFKRALVWLMAA